ncbi:MAG: hypothetical protein LV480_14640 [Methylacidiphilales bacterium]|nr:hypothetical protein [Candidatus Methylacidiphilales bacterium]
MKYPRHSFSNFCVICVLLWLMNSARATMMPPEMKAYDFARAYYIEDGGIVIVPQDGFYCPDAVKTPEGLRVMPGQTFIQFDPARLIMEVYRFTHLDMDKKRAYFHERRYRYKVVRTGEEKWRIVPLNYLDSDDFYLTQFRALEWFDFDFPYTEIHPGEQLWRTRP